MGFPTDSDFTNSANTPEVQKTLFETWLASCRAQPGCSIQNVDIAAGVLVPDRSFVAVRTEADAATDELTNILPTDAAINLVELRLGSGSEAITVKDEAGGNGQIHLSDGADRALLYGKLLRLYKEGDDWWERPLNVVVEDEYRGKNLAYNPWLTVDQIQELDGTPTAKPSGVYVMDCLKTISTTPTFGQHSKVALGDRDVPRVEAAATESGVIGWQQYNPNFALLAGKTVTVQAQVNGSCPARLVVKDGQGTYIKSATVSGATTLTYTVTVHSEATEFRVQLYLQNPTLGDWLRLDALKYEVGEQATEIEPVDHKAELARCQQFFRRVPIAGVHGFVRTTEAVWFALPISPMRIAPAVSLDATDYELLVPGGSSTIIGAGVGENQSSVDAMLVRLHGNIDLLNTTVGEPVIGKGSGEILLDANI